MGDAGPPGGLNGVLDSADEAIRAATPAAAAISAKRPTVTSATRHPTCGDMTLCGTFRGPVWIVRFTVYDRRGAERRAWVTLDSAGNLIKVDQ